MGSIETRAGLLRGRRANLGRACLRGQERESGADYKPQQTARLPLAGADRVAL